MAKNKVTITVHGVEYVLVGEETPEYMQRVAAYVDRRMEEAEVLGRIGEQRLAVLTALNVTDELMKARREIDQYKRDMADMQKKLRALESKNNDQ